LPLAAGVVAVTAIVVLAPFGTLPNVQFTTSPLTVHVPRVAVADAVLIPPASVTLVVTPEASFGPLFVDLLDEAAFRSDERELIGARAGGRYR
jgi:hypothetical protein